MEKGDVVEKASGNDAGKIGLVLDYFTNPTGHDFVTVMLTTGKSVSWYAKMVRVVHSSYDTVIYR